MTITECYTLMEADYDDVSSRLGSPENIIKGLVDFPEDLSYTELREAFASGDAESAFQSAHDLKEVCARLGLTRMTRSSDALMEALRSKEPITNVFMLLQQLQKDYEEALECINKFAQTQDSKAE